MASILSFRQPHQAQNWTNEELAELFRVVDILGRAGVEIATDMGLSDEGEPWFAFCRADTGDVIVHFSRIDGQFVAVSAATDTVVRGSNFRRVAETLVNRQPLILPAPSSGQKLFLHPAVIITALVATTLAQMKSWDGQGVFALHDVSDGAPTAGAAASFVETLKSGFIDALNLLLRGFAGPVEARNNAQEHSGVEALGLGLGNLSLASVVAFAISVIQGSPILEDIKIADSARHAPGNAAAAIPKAAGLAGLPQVADHERPSGDGAPAIAADSKEMAADRKAVHDHDMAVAAVMRKGEVADKSGPAASDDNGNVHVTRHDPSDRVINADIRDGSVPEKLAPVSTRQGAATTEPVQHTAQMATVNKEDAAAGTHVQASAATELHHFSFTEISREAIEIFFVKVDDSPAGTDAGLAFNVSPPAIAGGASPLTVDPAPAHTVLNASDIVFASGDPAALARLNQITDFVNSTDNIFSAPASFPELLSHYWSGDRPMTIVVFDSDALPLSIFSFTNDVLFVEERQLAGAALQTVHSGLHVDLANGGDVTLLGVINLHPAGMA